MSVRFYAFLTAIGAVLIGAAMFAIGVLMATHGDAGIYRSADHRTIGAHVGPVGAEYSSAPGARGLGVWGCVDPERRWYGVCRITGAYGVDVHREEAMDTVDSWGPIPGDLIAGLPAGRDWTVCEIHYADTTVIRCADGYTLES